jgi:DNA (cytosine-5)-methyltransferase 1
MPSFYEFFAGGGMARAGLGREWRCLFANDFDPGKSRFYRENWGDGELLTADVGSVSTEDVPGRADLAWASFPCQDLSLAGGGAGLKGGRSGAFWPFWRLIKLLADEERAPRIVALENVCGALTSRGGKDFTAICDSFQRSGYSVGAMVIDAALFVPQSRPRLFIIGALRSLETPGNLIAGSQGMPIWTPPGLESAYEKLPPRVKRAWIWWSLPKPASRGSDLSDVLEDDPADAPWFSESETRRLLDMMSEPNKEKLVNAVNACGRVVGAAYRRTRPDESGQKTQRLEIRFDGLAGCLRTPAGGSSRQLIVEARDGYVRTRLISARETARLMGLQDSYMLPSNYNAAYHLTGDGVVAPVVRHMARYIFEPLLKSFKKRSPLAA